MILSLGLLPLAAGAETIDTGRDCALTVDFLDNGVPHCGLSLCHLLCGKRGCSENLHGGGGLSEVPVRIDNREYIGVLSIPALGRELPVISSWDYPGLRVAPCRYTGSAYTDDLVIAAHNYASHFGRLRELSQGDSVRFTDTDGNVFDYVVSELEILEPYAVSQMTEGDWDLTLFTCTPGGQYRVTLRCNRI